MKSLHILKRIFSAIILMLVFIQLNSFLLNAKSFEKYNSFHQASILADADNGRILRNYRSQKTIYPASLVKMMVALITLEEKRHFLDEAANKNYILFLQHDPNYECCTVKQTEKGVRLNQKFNLSDIL